jgi:hypothetical protein
MGAGRHDLVEGGLNLTPARVIGWQNLIPDSPGEVVSDLVFRVKKRTSSLVSDFGFDGHFSTSSFQGKLRFNFSALYSASWRRSEEAEGAEIRVLSDRIDPGAKLSLLFHTVATK